MVAEIKQRKASESVDEERQELSIFSDVSQSASQVKLLRPAIELETRFEVRSTAGSVFCTWNIVPSFRWPG